MFEIFHPILEIDAVGTHCLQRMNGLRFQQGMVGVSGHRTWNYACIFGIELLGHLFDTTVEQGVVLKVLIELFHVMLDLIHLHLETVDNA